MYTGDVYYYYSMCTNAHIHTHKEDSNWVRDMPQRKKLAIHEITKQIEAYRLPSSHYLGRG